jgi:hypothetical protein
VLDATNVGESNIVERIFISYEVIVKQKIKKRSTILLLYSMMMTVYCSFINKQNCSFRNKQSLAQYTLQRYAVVA